MQIPIAWFSNDWHYIALVYSPSNSAIYVDGAVAATNTQISYSPGYIELTNDGFCVGSDLTGGQFFGQIDNLRTEGTAFGASTIRNQYLIGIDEMNGNPFYGGQPVTEGLP